MQHIKIKTKFDITHTGITRNLKKDLLPAKINGRWFRNESDWTKARCQQSNWETLIQVLSLRTQPLNIKSYKDKTQWVLEFDVAYEGIFGKDLELLKEDCENVPMITGLDERGSPGPVIKIDGNTKFEISDYDRL